MSDPIEPNAQENEKQSAEESEEQAERVMHSPSPAAPLAEQAVREASDDEQAAAQPAAGAAESAAASVKGPASVSSAAGPAIPVQKRAEPQTSAAPSAAAAAAEPEQASEEEKEEEEQTGLQSAFGPLNDQQKAYPWYVVNTYSGFEMNAKKNLEERIRANNLVERFGHVLIPQETVVELVRGQKKTSTRKFFPGYMLVQCDLDDETWHLVNGTPKVTGFVGDPRNPSPLSPDEVENLLKQMEGGAARPRPKVQFEQGDAIKVIDGPFTDFNGTVDEVRPDKGKLRVLISIFGRNTPVELDFVQVEKA